MSLRFREMGPRQAVSLNVTPLVDVLFLFIIFFTLTSTFTRVGELKLRLPESSTAEPSEPEEEIRQVDLIVTEDGRLFLADRPLELPALQGALRRILAEDPESRVLIKAEEGVRHGEVVRLLDIVRDAGFTRAGIGTQRKAPRDSLP